ncbi:MAG: PKD domain-containing protein, partial [Bacteroidota bacterium]
MLKQIFTFFFSLLLLTGGSLMAQGTFNNAHVVTYMPYAPCVGGPVLFNATDTTGQFPLATMFWDFGDGNTGSSFTGNSGVSNVYTSPGTYTVNFTALDSINIAEDSVTFQITVDSTCNNQDLVSGVTYLDANGNGIQNFNEPALPARMVTIAPGPFTFTTDQNGGYGLNLPAGSYTFTPLPLLYHAITQPGAGSYTVTSTGTGQVQTGNDFGFQPIPGINDLRVIVGSIPPVPGFDRVYTLNYFNVGTTTLNANLDFVYDSQLTFLGANSGGTNSGNTVSWSLGNVAPGASGIVKCTLNVPVNTVVGSFLSSVATINPFVGDTTPENNADSLLQEVVASYDPNDKAAIPAGNGVTGDINPGTDLTYTIRFQNTGNFPATFVYLYDTLDADLDWTTLEVLGASHPMTWYLNNGELVFKFDNINLPDSTSDEPNSHGFARYKISHKTGLPLGTELTNTASIYFDFNPPIVTNTTLNTLAVTVAVDEAFDNIEMQVVPHPFTDRAIVNFTNTDGGVHEFVLRDMQGRTVRQIRNIQGQSFHLERGALPAGMYLFSLTNEQGVAATGRLVV